MRRALAIGVFVALALRLVTSVPVAADAALPPDVISIDDPELLAAVAVVNGVRIEAGLPPIQPSATLFATAAWFVDDLATRGVLEHDDRWGRSPGHRFRAFGYPRGTYLYENVGRGYATGAAFVAGILASPPHRENALAPSARAYGLARGQAANGRWYWVMDLGSRVDRPFDAPGYRVVTLRTGWNLVTSSGPETPMEQVASEIPQPVDGFLRWDNHEGGWTSEIDLMSQSLNPRDALWLHLPHDLPVYWVQAWSPPDEPSPEIFSPGWIILGWAGPEIALHEILAAADGAIATAAIFDPERAEFVVESRLLPQGTEVLVAEGSVIWLHLIEDVAWPLAITPARLR